jgi:anti-sigma B factor antagonist
MRQSTVPAGFLCDVQPDRDRVVVRVVGELDFGVAPQVVAAVDELLDAGFARIVIDLRDLSFLDSAGVHTLVSARRSADRRGSALSVVPGPREVQRVFELTATDSLLAFEDAGVHA